VSLGPAPEVKLTSRGVFQTTGLRLTVFDDHGGRCGDSSAVVDANGAIWVANETIPCQELQGPGNGCFRSILANWGTLVVKINP
jgi:hypothetical protein